MNKVFENEYLMETRFYKEYVNNVLCKRVRILGLTNFVLGLFLHILVRDEITAIIAIIAVIAGIVAIVTPIITVKQLEAAGKSFNNGVQAKTNIKFADNIVMQEGKAHLEMEYQQITKVLQTKNFIVLKLTSQTAILVFKNGFLQGNEKDFLTFIEEKKQGKC